MRYFKYFGILSNLSLSVTISYFRKAFFLLSFWSFYSLNRYSTISEFLGLWIHFIREKTHSHSTSIWRRTLFNYASRYLLWSALLTLSTASSHAVRHFSLLSLGRLNKCSAASYKKKVQGKIQYLYTSPHLIFTQALWDIIFIFIALIIFNCIESERLGSLPQDMARSSIARTNHKIFVVSTMGFNIAKIARDSKRLDRKAISRQALV